jgi:hypothetical protein
MKLTFLILTICFTLTYASSIPSLSIIDALPQLLYTHLNPIFQNTFQQLIALVYELSEKLSQSISDRLIRSNPILPAPWVSQLFGGMNSISTQWNNHITDFFTHMPTIFEKNGRSLLNFSIIKDALYRAVENLLKELKNLFLNNINQSLISISNQSNFDILLNTFQQQVSDIFNQTKEQLNRNIDNAIGVILSYWNDLKDRFLG